MNAERSQHGQESGSGFVDASGEPEELRFRFECDSVDDFGAIYAPDISRGGIFIRTAELLPLASIVKIDLQLANGTTFISGEGLVFWVRQPDQVGAHGESGMGIRFTKITAESHRNLIRILAVKDAEESLQDAVDSDFDGGENECTVVSRDQEILAAASLWSVKAPVAANADQTVPMAAPAATAGALDESSSPAAAAPEVASVEAPSPAVAPQTVAPAAAAPEANAPASVPASLSRPIPALPDWAFVSTRFAVEDRAAQAATDAAVPQHIADDRRSALELSAPAQAASLRVSSSRRIAASLAARGGGSVGLVLGAALVLITALALAPHPKSDSKSDPKNGRTASSQEKSRGSLVTTGTVSAR
jgi:uncharacterized protein (TIGR02266 family)